jgi:putative hemolysin
VQALRYQVFVEEMGARVAGAEDGLERDRFDGFCDHLLVREGEDGRVVGTYRALAGVQAARLGGFYSESEFDLGALKALQPQTVEVGRACVAPEFRNGLVIALLWSALLRYVLERGFRYAIGCGSVDTHDGGHAAATICRQLLTHHLGPEEWRVHPRRSFVLEGWDDVPGATIPPLIKGYLRLGAFVCGAPAWDGDFDCADLLLMLPMEQIDARYVDRLLRRV